MRTSNARRWMTGRLTVMRKRISIKRVSGGTATLFLAAVGTLVGVEAAVVDTNALLRLLDFYDLNPLV